jgi:hypothetical protein
MNVHGWEEVDCTNIVERKFKSSDSCRYIVVSGSKL